MKTSSEIRTKEEFKIIQHPKNFGTHSVKHTPAGRVSAAAICGKEQQVVGELWIVHPPLCPLQVNHNKCQTKSQVNESMLQFQSAIPPKNVKNLSVPYRGFRKYIEMMLTTQTMLASEFNFESTVKLSQGAEGSHHWTLAAPG